MFQPWKHVSSNYIVGVIIHSLNMSKPSPSRDIHDQRRSFHHLFARDIFRHSRAAGPTPRTNRAALVKWWHRRYVSCCRASGSLLTQGMQWIGLLTSFVKKCLATKRHRPLVSLRAYADLKGAGPTRSRQLREYKYQDGDRWAYRFQEAHPQSSSNSQGSEKLVAPCIYSYKFRLTTCPTTAKWTRFAA